MLWFALVEDYVPGASLKELLNQNQKFTEKQVTKIIEFIADIQDIYVTYNSKGKGITIVFSPYLNRFIRRSFGRTLSEPELIWLAQEIRDWLQLQKQREATH